MAVIVTGNSPASVYELAIFVTFGDYSGRTVNLSPRLAPGPGNLGGCRAAVIAEQPQFSPPQRRIGALRKQPPRCTVARLREGNRDIRIDPERQRLSLAAVSVLVVPVPAALGPNEKIETSAEGDFARISNRPVDARPLPRPSQAGS